jgi:hypothetical protein
MPWNPKESGAASARRYVESIRGTVVSAGLVDTVRAMFASGMKEAHELLASKNEIERQAGEYWNSYYSTAVAYMAEWVNGRG